MYDENERYIDLMRIEATDKETAEELWELSIRFGGLHE